MVPLSNVMATPRWGRFPEESFTLLGGFVPDVCSRDAALLELYVER